MSSRFFGGRTLARSQALQLLFQAEATDRTVEEVLAGAYALSEGPLDEFGERLALGADAMRSDLDGVIARASTNWSVSRMPSVDRNLLRLALYEMLCVDEVAVPITIDESVELAKAYGTDESSRFVNGLLGRVATELEEGIDVLHVDAELAAGSPDSQAHDAAEPNDHGEQGGSNDADGDAAHGTPAGADESSPQE